MAPGQFKWNCIRFHKNDVIKRAIYDERFFHLFNEYLNQIIIKNDYTNFFCYLSISMSEKKISQNSTEKHS